MKRLAGIIFGTILSLSMAFTSLAGTWIQDDNGWWYQNDDGSYPVNEWTVIDGITYHFDSNGYMDVDGSNTSGSEETSDSVLKTGYYHASTAKYTFDGRTISINETVSVTTADSNSLIIDDVTYSCVGENVYSKYTIGTKMNTIIYVSSKTEYTVSYTIGISPWYSKTYTYIE